MSAIHIKQRLNTISLCVSGLNTLLPIWLLTFLVLNPQFSNEKKILLSKYYDIGMGPRMWIYEIWRVFLCSSNLFCPIPQMGLPFPITVLIVSILLFLFTFYARATLPSYSSSNGQLTGVFHPSSHPSHNGGLATSLKRPNSQSGSSHSQSFRLKSDLSSRCSWKFVAIFFMLFSFLLVTALIYTAGNNRKLLMH